jgi:hypothetical protein
MRNTSLGGLSNLVHNHPSTLSSRHCAGEHGTNVRPASGSPVGRCLYLWPGVLNDGCAQRHEVGLTNRKKFLVNLTSVISTTHRITVRTLPKGSRWRKSKSWIQPGERGVAMGTGSCTHKHRRSPMNWALSAMKANTSPFCMHMVRCGVFRTWAL